MSVFFCDTNCELSYDVFKTLDAKLIKMPYTLNGEEAYYDLGENTDNRKFFDAMRNGASAKTQALNEYDYIEYFEPVFKAGEDILYVSFSHKMSGTFLSMQKAVDELLARYPERKFTVIDTKGISMGAGVVVKYAAELKMSGCSDEEIVEKVAEFRKKVCCYFTVDDLEYLKRGGRLTSFKCVVGKLLGIKPIIKLTKDGTLDNTEKSKGRKAALKRLVELLEEDDVDVTMPICLLNADCDEDAALVKELILQKYPTAVVNEQLVGPVIGSHCGPDTIGIIFVSKTERD